MFQQSDLQSYLQFILREKNVRIITPIEEFKNNTNTVLIETVNWFQSNFLKLNCDKTHLLQFLTKKKQINKNANLPDNIY